MDSIRFYKNIYPLQDDMVMVKILEKTEFGYQGELVEYNNLQAVADFNQLVKRRLTKKNLFKIGDIVPLQVIRIDKDKKCVELSKKRVEMTDIESLKAKYEMCSQITKLISEMFLLYKNFYKNNATMTLDDLMSNIVWDKYEIDDESEEIDYSQILNGFLKEMDGQLLAIFEDEKFKDYVKDNLQNRLIKKSCIVQLEITLLITNENAIDKIKDILTVELGNDENRNYNVTIIAASPPKYKIRIEGMDKEKCEELSNKIYNIMNDKYRSMHPNRGNILSKDNYAIEKDSTLELRFLNKKEIDDLILN